MIFRKEIKEHERKGEPIRTVAGDKRKVREGNRGSEYSQNIIYTYKNITMKDIVHK
jgi:hypothetical protein